MTEQELCPIHNCPLEIYTTNGEIWLGKGKGFDTSPKTHVICPKCENGEFEVGGKTMTTPTKCPHYEGEDRPNVCPACKSATPKAIYKGWGDETYLRNYFACRHPWHTAPPSPEPASVLDRILRPEEECDCAKGTFCIVHGVLATNEASASVRLDGDTRRCCNDPECGNDWPCALHPEPASVPQPTYYVAHPDGLYSKADPQPVAASVAAERDREADQHYMEGRDHWTQKCADLAACIAVQSRELEQLREWKTDAEETIKQLQGTLKQVRKWHIEAAEKIWQLQARVRELETAPTKILSAEAVEELIVEIKRLRIAKEGKTTGT